VPVPSTDGHYNLRDLLPEGDYLYGCWARWSGLNCYRFSKTTGAGASIGSVAPAGFSDINYHTGVKIREDAHIYMARVGTGTEWYLFKFKGTPSQITDSAQWEGIGYMFRDPTTPSSCADGAINYSYCWYFWKVNERYIMTVCNQRCPTGNIGNFAIYIFDVLTEKLYNSNFEPVSFGLPTTDPSVKITVTNPPSGYARAEGGMAVVDWANKVCYVGRHWFTEGVGWEAGIVKVDMRTRQGTFVKVPTASGSPVFPLALTVDGKLVLLYKDTDGVVKVNLFNPDTGTVEGTLLSGLGIAEYRTVALATEDVMINTETIVVTGAEIILAPNWQDGLKRPKRITVTPGAGTLRVQAQFQATPGSIRVRVWKIPDYTVAVEETLAGATSLDKTYSLVAGRYRVEVTAIP
jgi:hypothetical protein